MKRPLAFFLLLSFAGVVHAHPVPRSSHDRTIAVHLKQVKDDRYELLVKYRLEVDELTVVLEDMEPFRDEVNFKDYRKRPLDYYSKFASIYGPILADNLIAKAGKDKLTFTCLSFEPQLRDEKGEALGHLRCDFTFRTEFRLGTGTTPIRFEETNYLLQKGDIKLSLVNDTKLAIDSLKTEDRLMTFTLDPALRTDAAVETPVPAPETAPRDDDNDLLRIARSGQSLWWVLLAAFGFGAAHALTPGHGKTLVAAYLVGSRGTVLHAFALGLVTTLTHTGAVLLFAAILPSEVVRSGLGLAMGIVIVLMGSYQFVQRLAGQADHVHIGGGHHHHHGPGHTHHHAPAENEHVTWWNLIVLGIAGGIVPCWDAVALLLFMVGSDQQDRALPVLLLFSLGLASVLVVIGIAVVKLRGFAGSQFGEGRWTKWLSIVSALAICAMGFWLCAQAVR